MAASAQMTSGTTLFIAYAGDPRLSNFRGVCARVTDIGLEVIARVQNVELQPPHLLHFCRKVGNEVIVRNSCGLENSNLRSAIFVAIRKTRDGALTEFPIVAPPPPPFQPALFYCLMVSENNEGTWFFGETENLLPRFRPRCPPPPPSQDLPELLFNCALQILAPLGEQPDQDLSLQALSPYELHHLLTEYDKRANQLMVTQLHRLEQDRKDIKWEDVLKLIQSMQALQEAMRQIRLEINRRNL